MKYRTIEEWPFEQAMLESDRDANPARRDAPLFVWQGFRDLEKLEREFVETGSGYAVLAAIRKCAQLDIVLPAWLAEAYIARYDQILNFRADSWDKVFGKPLPKGAHLSAMRKKRMFKFAVWNDIQALLKSEHPPAIDKALFESVGRKYGLGTTLTEEYYYSVASGLIRSNAPRKVSKTRGNT